MAEYSNASPTPPSPVPPRLKSFPLPPSPHSSSSSSSSSGSLFAFTFPSSSAPSSLKGSFYDPSSLPPIMPTFIRRILALTFLCLICITPVLIPMEESKKGDLGANKGYLLIVALMSMWLWIPRFIFVCDELGPPPITKLLAWLFVHLRIPDSALYYFKFWPCIMLSVFTALFVVIIPSMANTFPIPFLGIACPIIFGLPSSYLIVYLLYPARLRTDEFKEKLRRVAYVLYVPFGYTLCGFGFLCGFYVTYGTAVVQLVLVCVINFLTFCIRLFMRRMLRKLQMLHLEGPIMFYVFSLSQYFTLQSLPTSAQAYVYIGSFLMKVFSGCWPLINWQSILSHKSGKVGLEEGTRREPTHTSRELRREDSRIFGFFAHHLLTGDDKEMEREALNSFVIMLSSILACILFVPLFLFYFYGWSKHYFIYGTLDSTSAITLLIYMGLTVLVTSMTFLFTNQYFKHKYQIDSLRVGVNDFKTNFPSYFAVSMYAIVVFVVFNLRQTDVVHNVAGGLYED